MTQEAVHDLTSVTSLISFLLLSANSTGLGLTRPEPEDKLLATFSYLMWRQDTRTIGLFSGETPYTSSVWGSHRLSGHLDARHCSLLQASLLEADIVRNSNWLPGGSARL